MNLILFGYPTCGKTSFGKRLAKKLQISFIDTDKLIENLYFKDYKKELACREIYKKHGCSFYRSLEKRAILSCENSPCVIALGGGAILCKKNKDHLEKIGQLIYLKDRKENIYKKLQKNKVAFLDYDDFENSFNVFYNERINIYENINAIVIDLQNHSFDQILKKLEIKNGKQ
jgi:shikimate kinase